MVHVETSKLEGRVVCEDQKALALRLRHFNSQLGHGDTEHTFSI